MTRLPGDCFSAEDRLMPLAEALATLEDRLHPVAPTVRLPLADAAGRLLAEDLLADRTVPPHDNAAVDGYGVIGADLTPDGETVLPVVGRVAAGHRFDRPARRGEAVRIFTGAPLPAGIDTVAMQEDCRLEGAGDALRVVLPAGLKAGSNARHAGEDILPGDRVLRAGQRLRPQDIGLAASLGHAELPVFAPLRVAVLSTGDEVVEPGRPLPDGAIYDSNRHGLIALLGRMGCRVTDLGILPDDRPAIRDTLAAAAREHDAILTSGGMSTGEEDHLKPALEAAGGSLSAWRLAIKPGRPVALGLVPGGDGRQAVFCGLPGNPVAVMVTFLLLARPLLLRLAGADPALARPTLYPVPAGFAMRKKPGRREFLRGILERDATGRAGRVTLFPRDGSGILTSMVAADGLVVLAEEVEAVAVGDPVDFLPFAEVL